MADPSITLRMMAIIAEVGWRAERLAASIGRLDAQSRLGVFLLDIYDRLRQRGLVSRPSYNLPLTQKQIADHLGLTLVHVNRTLRLLREERIVDVDRQVVIIADIERLREVALGLPQRAEMPELYPNSKCAESHSHFVEVDFQENEKFDITDPGSGGATQCRRA
jgi:hypothetical protein